jgi:hypothetical protein
MPLDKSTSKEAFGKNVGAEIRAGKPKDQAVAIAYSVKREAAKKHKKSHSYSKEDVESAKRMRGQ